MKNSNSNSNSNKKTFLKGSNNKHTKGRPIDSYDRKYDKNNKINSELDEKREDCELAYKTFLLDDNNKLLLSGYEKNDFVESDGEFISSDIEYNPDSDSDLDSDSVSVSSLQQNDNSKGKTWDFNISDTDEEEIEMELDD